MGPLFDKSMDELREALVRTRCDEYPSDITMCPDSSLFRHFLENVWDGSWYRRVARSRILRDNATPHVGLPVWNANRHKQGDRRRVETLLNALHAGGTSIYYPTRSVPVIALDRNLYAVQTPIPHGPRWYDCGIRPATMWEVMWILHAEITETRPNAAKARTFLTQEFETAMKATRATAESEFHNAVAIHADGTGVVETNWVIVVSKSNSKLYPGAAFLNSKAKLSERGVRSGHYRVENSQKGVLAYLTSEKNRLRRFRELRTEHLILDCTWGNTVFQILCIRDDFCPSPLPEGGIEIPI